jgi:hypothetical protein
MPDLDLEPRRHSHLYEVKPMSRWWLVIAASFAVLMVYLNGVGNLWSWGLLFSGVLLSWLVIAAFPKTFLSKLD